MALLLLGPEYQKPITDIIIVNCEAEHRQICHSPDTCKGDCDGCVSCLRETGYSPCPLIEVPS